MKRLVYCFDGTWNDDTGNAPITNVVRFHRAVIGADARGVQQISRYIVGIATSFKGRKRFWMGALGVEVGRRVLSAYSQLMADYEPGDEIYLYGFSRGAYEARLLASFVAMFGIGDPNGGFRLKSAWDYHRRYRAQADPAALEALRVGAHFPVQIGCVGVWDTVGNLGIPFLPDGLATRRLNQHDAHLPAAVAVGLHALSIDEQRGPFSPSLWSLRQGAALPPGQSVDQVWFAGSHGDVGGGYKETGLSDVSLLWMAEKTTSETPLALDLDLLLREARPDAFGAQHDEATGQLYGWTLMLPFIRFINQDKRPLSLARWLAFRYWRTNLLPAGETALNERLHESVLQRCGRTVTRIVGGNTEDITYDPANARPTLREQAQERLA